MEVTYCIVNCMTKIDEYTKRSIIAGFYANVVWPLVGLLLSAIPGILAWLSFDNLSDAIIGFFLALGVVTAVFVIRAAYAVQQWLDSPKYKLEFEAFPAIVEFGEKAFALTPRLKVINLGYYPIHVDSSETRWSINNRTGTDDADKLMVGVIPAQGWQWLNGSRFEVESVQSPNDLKEVLCIVELKMKYGKPNNIKFEHIAKYRLHYMYDARLNSEGSLSLIDFERFV